ncbi:GntR family transcriptional regulator [Streptomyces sp. NPDC056652]|uniref:GntR family transcriptional regulator n=1 Tax=Streptomyces sp. NPDC056652 TaxID=3345893 RepID=UPI0036B53772
MPIPNGPRTYRELAELLRGQIEGGERPPGAMLPTIKELMETYGLARQTVRAAIGQLAAEGLVRTVPREGTIVQARPERRRVRRNHVVTRRTPTPELPGMYIFPAAARPDEPWETHGDPYRSYESAPEVVTAQFGLEAGTNLLRRRRVMSPKGEPPFQIVDTWLSLRAVADAPRVAEEWTGPGGYLDRLEEAGHGPISWSEITRVRMPSSEEADLLKIPVALPVMEMILIGTSGSSGDALEVTIRVIPGDRVELVADLVRDASAAWPREEVRDE